MHMAKTDLTWEGFTLVVLVIATAVGKEGRKIAGCPMCGKTSNLLEETE